MLRDLSSCSLLFSSFDMVDFIFSTWDCLHLSIHFCYPRPQLVEDTQSLDADTLGCTDCVCLCPSGKADIFISALCPSLSPALSLSLPFRFVFDLGRCLGWLAYIHSSEVTFVCHNEPTGTRSGNVLLELPRRVARRRDNHNSRHQLTASA